LLDWAAVKPWESGLKSGLPDHCSHDWDA